MLFWALNLHLRTFYFLGIDLPAQEKALFLNGP